MNRQVPMIQTVQKFVEVPQVQCIDKVVEVPVENAAASAYDTDCSEV